MKKQHKPGLLKLEKITITKLKNNQLNRIIAGGGSGGGLGERSAGSKI